MSPSWFWKRPSRPTRPSGVCLTHIASLYNSLLSNHLPPVLQWTSRWMERLRKSRMNGDWGVGSALVMFCLECVVVPMRLRWLMCSCVLPAFGVGCDLVVCLFRFALFCYIRQLEELKKAGDADPMTAFGKFRYAIRYFQYCQRTTNSESAWFSFRGSPFKGWELMEIKIEKKLVNIFKNERSYTKSSQLTRSSNNTLRPASGPRRWRHSAEPQRLMVPFLRCLEVLLKC